MKKLAVFLFVGLFLLGVAGIAGASIVQEQFLFGTNSNPMSGWLNAKDRYVYVDFNLNYAGNQATSLHVGGSVLDTKTPVTDAAGAGPWTNLNWARLSMTIFSENSIPDPYFISAQLQGGGEAILYMDVADLTNASKEIELSITDTLFEQLQNTGRLQLMICSPYWVDYKIYPDNSFILHEVTLTTEASVPEPSTLLFLFSGVLGVIGFGRGVRCVKKT